MLVSDFSLNLVEIMDSDKLKFRNPKVEPRLVKHVYDLAGELAPEYDEEKIVG